MEAITVRAIDYEQKHCPMPLLDPEEAIKQRIEMLNLNRKDPKHFRMHLKGYTSGNKCRAVTS